MKSNAVLIGLMMLGTVTGASAQSPQQQVQAGGYYQGMGPGGQGGGMGYQQSARPEIAACSGKASGAACSFVGRQGEQITGTCFTPPAGGPAGTPPACCRPGRN